MSTTIRMFDGDILINSAGRSESITAADKCSQDIAEVLLTPLAERDYGSELATLQIPQPVTVFAGKALISRKVDEAIQRLKRFQLRDVNAGPEERIDKINKLIVKQIDSRDFIFWINVWLEDRTITGNQILAVSLRHQPSARFVGTAKELAASL